ncbi:MAG: hypothetical protein CMJ83_19610 [Planctomycetes bacterium]|nr:hypothetical protein [Planctomycetota bacterium]
MTISRRQFVGSAGAAAVGLSVLERDHRAPDADPSGLVTGKPKPLPYTEVKGFLSKDQVRWHHDSHYGGALRGFVKLDADPTGNHRPRIAKANSVLLHELYFDNMAAKKSDPGQATRAALKKRFGDLDRWIEDFRAAAKSCRGWAVLSWHPVNGKLYNVCTDSHDDGPVWSGVPLVVADTYEHSYYIDFQNRKADYVNGFTDHINWTAVEQRVRALG